MAKFSPTDGIQNTDGIDFHELIVGENHHWQVPVRYENLRSCGAGAYGRVCRAYDNRLQRDVAIKQLSRPFDSTEYAKRTYREMKILSEMDNENIISLIDVFSPQSTVETVKDVYMVTSFMNYDLSQVIKSQQLGSNHICFFVYQILRGLKYMHSAGLVHRDLKPANIGVTSDLELKILDFGLARTHDSEMTGYIATRWYRAPEVMYNWCHYTESVDLWSVGCIMAELFNRAPLFPGINHIDQLKRTLRLLGNPDEELMYKIESESAQQFLRSLEIYPPQDLASVVRTSDPNSLNMLRNLLVLDPARRYTTMHALNDLYVLEYHDENDEPTRPPLESTYELDSANRSLDGWKRLTLDLMHNFRPFSRPIEHS